MTVSEIKNYINNSKDFSSALDNFCKEERTIIEKVDFFRAIDEITVELTKDDNIKEINESTRNNIVGLYRNYMKNYFCDFDSSLLNAWNNDYPYTIKLGYQLEQLQIVENRKAELKYIRADLRESALKLIERVNQSENEKEIYFSYKKDNGERVNEKLIVTPNKNTKPDDYTNLLYDIYMMLCSNGAMVVSETFTSGARKGKSNVYVVKATTDCTWVMVPAKDAKQMFLHDENGNRLKMVPGVKFVEG